MPFRSFGKALENKWVLNGSQVLLRHAQSRLDRPILLHLACFFAEASSGARVDVEFVAGRTASRATLHYLIWIYLVISLIIVDVNCTLDRLRFQRVCL